MLLFVGNSFRWWSQVSVTESRTREKLLRSPGESMRRNLEQLNEYLIYSVALFLFVPMVFAWKAPNLTSAWPLIFLVVLMVTCAIPGICVVHLSRNYALALRGERAAGEELNQLMLDGCHVFHDYPVGPDWNINHIVIAPSGVYAIETTTHRNPRSHQDVSQEPEVIFDGSALRFPDCTCAEPILQTGWSAIMLQRELDLHFEVKAILSVPGWRVIRRNSQSDVSVLNPKEIWQCIVTTAPPKLSDEQIQRIAYHIQQKCRDVEM
jgi:hypothetical protein